MKILSIIITLLAYMSCNAQDTIRKYNDSDSSIIMVEFVVNNDTKKPDGFYKVYFENGTLREHRVFKNGHLWDIILLKTSDGRVIKDVGTLKNGTGTVKNFDEKNNLQALTTYKDGILYGESIKYYDNGKIAMKGEYYDGHRCGTWYRYNKEGNLKENGEREFRIECENGQPNPKYKN